MPLRAEVVLSDEEIAEMTPRHRDEEFRRFLTLIDSSAPALVPGADDELDQMRSPPLGP